MMTFSSVGNLARLQKTDPATPVISKLVHGLNEPATIALMQPDDTYAHLADLCNAEDVTLEGIVERENMYLVVFQTDYGYGIVIAVPIENWITGELHQCIEDNLYN